MRGMRVAWDIPPLSVPMTGIGRYMQQVILALAVQRPDWEIRLVCVAEAEGCDLAAAAFAQAPANVGVVPVVRRPAVLERRLATRFGVRPIERYVGAVDAFVDSEWYRPAQGSGARLTVVYDLIPFRYPEWVDPRTRRAHLRAMRTLSSRVDRVIAISEATRADVERFADVDPSRVSVAYSGIDAVFRRPDPVAPAVVGAHPYVIAVGTTTQRKNLEVALQALREVGDEHLHLVCVGASADAEGAIQRQVAQLGLQGRVHRLGYVADHELAGHVAAAECLVFPSRFEGFGLPVVEAMAAGVSVAVSSAPSLDEAAGDAAVRFDPEDPRAAAEAIAETREPGVRDDLVARGFVHAAGFTWERSGEAIATAIEQAVREKAGA